MRLGLGLGLGLGEHLLRLAVEHELLQDGRHERPATWLGLGIGLGLGLRLGFGLDERPATVAQRGEGRT